MRITKKALEDLGYDVMPFVLEDNMWRKPVDFMMGMVTNGSAKAMLEDFDTECEQMLKPLENTAMIMGASWIKRHFIDFALTYIKNAGRSCRNMNGLRKLNET